MENCFGNRLKKIATAFPVVKRANSFSNRFAVYVFLVRTSSLQNFSSVFLFSMICQCFFVDAKTIYVFVLSVYILALASK